MPRYSYFLLAIISAFLALPASAPVFAETVAGAVSEGNTLYRGGKYEEALKKYEAAQVESPDDERIMFNLGGAQYKLENYERAVEEFIKAAPSKDKKIGARSHYNTGNALYRAGRLEDAVAQYLKALDIDYEDGDAKHNLEFVRREIQRRMEQQQERQEQKKQQDQQQEPDDSSEIGEPQPKDQEAENQQGQPAENEQQQEPKAPEQKEDSNPDNSPQQNESEQPEPPNKGDEPREEASDESMQRWLDAVEAESAEHMKEFLRKQQPNRVIAYPEDW